MVLTWRAGGAGGGRGDRRGRGRQLVGRARSRPAVLVAVIVADLVALPVAGQGPVRRAGDTSVRLGEQAQTQLMLTNHSRRAT